MSRALSSERIAGTPEGPLAWSDADRRRPTGRASRDRPKGLDSASRGRAGAGSSERIAGTPEGPLAWSEDNRQRGFVGGFEVLPFGVLVFVAGALLLTNAWAVVDAKLAASAAAREAVRAYVEAPTADEATDAAIDAAMNAISGHGRDPGRAEVVWAAGPDFRRCQVNTIVVRYRVPTLTVPFIGAFGSGVIETSARHSEIVDPYRTGLDLAPNDADPCDA